jgi:hypothetical protein
MIGKVVSVAGLCLAVTAGASAGPAASLQADVRVPATRAEVRVCQRPTIMCAVRCRTIVARRPCQPGTMCLFNDYAWCRCYYQAGACRLRCKARRVQRACGRSGWCQAPIRRCRCGGRLLPPGPSHK